MLISFFLVIIISTSLTEPAQPSPRFHVEGYLSGTVKWTMLMSRLVPVLVCMSLPKHAFAFSFPCAYA